MAGVILLLVTRIGRLLSHAGLGAWWAPVLPGALIVVFFHWLGRSSKILETV
jgi:hypothetical protein